jgi:hypothetical protein
VAPELVKEDLVELGNTVRTQDQEVELDQVLKEVKHHFTVDYPSLLAGQ